MLSRREQLKARLKALKVPALLLFDMNNIRYLTGFSGEEGILFTDLERWVLLVDGRYVTQAREEVPPEVEIVLIRDPIGDVASYVGDGRVSYLAVEAHALAYENFLKLRRALKGVRCRAWKNLIEPMRMCKDGSEVASIKKAAEMAEEALQEVIPLIRPGVAEREIAIELEYRMRKKGALEAAFPTIVASGPRAAMPHARPGTHVLKKGEVVILDFGAVGEEGYRSDETCTFLLGRTEEVMRAYQVVREAQMKAIEAIRPGVKCAYVDHVAREVISRAGYGDFFSHGTGHGVGLGVHEAPRLGPHSREVLEEGMVVTVEPGIYLPGRWGIRLEDMVLVTEKGSRLITGFSKEPTILD
ncbi:MAG TPA: Xaa-Pro peptidase family protein [Syntrophales bacterium]|nr:Xaa-Pro peptidase family protein [Syntrophales bacterium]